MSWRFQLFGGLRAVRGDQTITRCQTYKTGALLAYLAYFRGRPHSREELITILWPDADPTAARSRLSQALVWLRPRLEPAGVAPQGVLFSDRHSVGLQSEQIQTDVAQFESLLSPSPSASPAQQIAVLRRAADLYGGELLPGFYEDWIFPERQRHAAAFVGALRRMTALYEQERQFDLALDSARRALSADPLIEESHRDLIRLLADGGQTAAALRQYHELEILLQEKLGESPSAQTRTLVETIRQEAPRAAPAIRTTTPAKLPLPLTRFFGRSEEIARVEEFLGSGETRLLTLIGPGGCGKTRLALEIISRRNSRFAGDIWFVPLADLHDARRIPHAIADVIRTPGPDGLSVRERVIEWLAWRPALLVLDNLEHLIEEAAALIRELLERVPHLTILATSRQCTGVEGEREIPVQPLPLPGDLLTSDAIAVEALLRCESVQLFLDRAQGVRPSFRIDAENAREIAQICNRLEGVPLALELCAAWAQTLTPAQMLEQLNRPFDLLVSRRREVPARHRSLWAALAYSYEQLPAAQQEFFTYLSVFRSGWTLEAAEAVCLTSPSKDTWQREAQTLDLLTALRERSLITAEEIGRSMRFRMLETVREFAAEQLAALAPDAAETVRRQHALYFLRVAESAEPHLVGPEQLEHIHRLSADHDNFKAALGWAVATGDAEIGMRLAGALTLFWDARGFIGEGQYWLTQVLSLQHPEPDRREQRLIHAKALTARGNLARNQGSTPGVDEAMQQALQIWRECGSQKGTAEALQIMATIAYSRDDFPTARNYLQEGLLLARQLEEPLLIALTLHNLGNIALANGGWAEASSCYTESLSLYRAVGNRSRSARVLNNLGLVARYQRDYRAATMHLHEALESCRELSDRSGMAIASLNLATVNRLEGHFTSAGSFLDEAAHHSSEAGEQRLLPWCVRERGHLLCAQADYAQGIRLLGAAESQRRSIGILFKPADPHELEQVLPLARAALGEERCAALWAVGAALPRSHVYAEALHLPTKSSTFH